MSNLSPFKGDLVERTRNLALLSEADLKRFAAAAARDRDVEKLWSLTEAHLTLHGAAGSRISKHTLSGYKRYGKRLIEAWANETLLRPSRSAGPLWVRELEAEFKPKTVSVNLAAGRALYAALRWSGATDANPFSDTKPARDLTPAWAKREAYSVTELEWLLRCASSYTLYIVLLGAHAGLRASEMVNLTWEAIELDTKRLTVVEGKGGKTAFVYMSKTLVSELASVPEDKRVGHLLPCRTRQGVNKRMSSLCRRAGVKDRGVHALRHSAGTKLLSESGNLVLVAEHLRHASLDTARGYAHQDNKQLKEAVGDW